MPPAAPSAGADFRHLVRMTDERGLFEHALFADPRPEHGYCTDDMARLLVVATREPHPTAATRKLAEASLCFLREAQGVSGNYYNRMDSQGHWAGWRTVEDCWGRSIWGLGTAVARSDVDSVRHAASTQLERAVQLRSPWPRAMAFATLGAAELLTADPGNHWARTFMSDAADGMELWWRSGNGSQAGLNARAGWLWPEPRLSYANAIMPEAMIAAGEFLGRSTLLGRGLELLAWLLDHETHGGHLSVTPVGGSAAGDPQPRFDQQPIEVAALADACNRAAATDGRVCWSVGLASSVAWFLGDNDGQRVMWDRETGGGFDGLQECGVNLNQGAESTLALLSTMQHGRSMLVVAS